jgi:hypothetical protein
MKLSGGAADARRLGVREQGVRAVLLQPASVVAAWLCVQQVILGSID